MNLKNNKKSLFLVFYGFTFFALLSSLIMSYLTNKPLFFFFRDISTITNTPFYTGYISQLGNLLWAILSGICIYICCIFYTREGQVDLKKFYLWSSILILILTFDDIFLIHEDAMYSIFGVSQKYVYGFYILVVIIYLIRFNKYILSTKYISFVIALVFFGASVALDYIRDIFELNENFILLEDGFKLLGITSWVVYFSSLGIEELGKICSNKTL